MTIKEVANLGSRTTAATQQIDISCGEHYNGNWEPHYSQLCETIMAFGTPAGAHYGHLLLDADGSIHGYNHPNESHWRPAPEDSLEFLNAQGQPTSRLWHTGSNVWLGKLEQGLHPLHLNPLFSLAPSPRAMDIPAVIVNTIPKAGTYMLEAVLREAGIPASHLHLSGRTSVDDYRNVPDSQIHRAPHMFKREMPLDLVAILARGYVTPAHVEHGDVITAMERRGAHFLHVKRDLRNVVLSLYHFKQNTVAPVDGVDESWRKLDEPDRFTGFLYYFARYDLTHIGAMAWHLASRPSLRFEAALSGELDATEVELLEAIQPGLGTGYAATIEKVRGKPTSTLSRQRSDWRHSWSAAAEAVFRGLGLEDANVALGYPSGDT